MGKARHFYRHHQPQMAGMPAFGKTVPQSRKTDPALTRSSGTDCHELCAYLVEKSLGKGCDRFRPKTLLITIRRCGDCAESYCSYVNETDRGGKEALPGSAGAD